MPYRSVEDKRAFQRRWKAERRATWFADRHCTVCGSTENLQLDHVDAHVKVSHKIWSWSTPRREAELAKCQVLCERCHRAKTLACDIKRTSHGTGQMYQKYKCRCDACRTWKRDSDGKYRRKV